MAIYAIGDLHLAFNEDKPMNIFGDNWEDHENKIKSNWEAKIKDDDVVILPGDFSWAMYLKDAVQDFEYLNNLPGHKILIKGNHDYWWTTITSMNNFIKENNFNNINFLLNSAFEYENKIIVGTRGWTFNQTENSEKMHTREINRLELSIKDGKNKYGEDKEIICAMHYPPITKTMLNNKQKSEYIEIMQEHGIKTCLYGHLHGKAQEEAVEGQAYGIDFKLVSSDYLNFEPYNINKIG